MRELYTKIEAQIPVKIEVELEAQQMVEQINLYPWLYTVFIKLKDPLSDGLATEDEEEFLSECKERLALRLQENQESVYVGSKITDGWYELYFYLQDPKGIENKTKDILKAFEYPFESNAVKDKKWDLYETSLYPNIVQAHHIQTRQIIRELMEEGDDISVSREVEHYMLFQTPSLREKFLDALESYDLVSKMVFERDEDEFVYGVTIVSVQNLDAKQMDTFTDRLIELSEKYHAHYEGWSTSFLGEQG